MSFPSKFNTLPDIAGQPPVDVRQLVQYKDNQLTRSFDRSAVRPGAVKNGGNLQTDDRLDQLELRVAFAERSSQAVFQELVRNQAEHSDRHRQAEDALQREYASRQQLETAVQFNRGQVAQLTDRLARGEARRSEDQTVLALLTSKLNGVEHESRVGHQEISSKRDANAVKYV